MEILKLVQEFPRIEEACRRPAVSEHAASIRGLALELALDLGKACLALPRSCRTRR